MWTLSVKKKKKTSSTIFKVLYKSKQNFCGQRVQGTILISVPRIDTFYFYFLSFETFALITPHITNTVVFTVCIANVMSSSV